MSVTTSKNINYCYYRETGPGSDGAAAVRKKPLAAVVEGDLARVWRSVRTCRARHLGQSIRHGPRKSFQGRKHSDR